MNNKTIDVLQSIILFAGDSGDGMQLTGNQFTDTVTRVGKDVSILPDYPAEIRAPIGTVSGISGFQIHFGSVKITSPGDKCDVLVAMNSAAVKKYIKKLKPNGIIIANLSGFDAKNLRLAGYENSPIEELKSNYKVYEIDISKLTQAALKEMQMNVKDAERSKNMFALGFIYWLFSEPLKYTENFLETKFGKDSAIYLANKKALEEGYKYGEITDTFNERYKIEKADMLVGEYRNIAGNEAIALGFIAAAKKAGKDLFFGGYPITPASEILQTLNLYRAFGVKIFQAEDEIAAIASAIGASFAGDLGITASSGPGIALKTEAMGLAVMLEIPLVIVNVQRGGPSTGLPTKTEQADLLQAVYGRNGEAPIPVIASYSPSNCFEAAFKAAKIALEHNTPVILLSDGYIANGAEPWLIKKEADLPIITPKVVKEGEGENYLPYERDENFVRKIAYPGTKGYEHRIGGLEKDVLTGNISYDPENHQKMVKLRQAKVDAIANFYPETKLNYSADSDTLVLSWGGTYGAVVATVRNLNKEGFKVDFLHLEYICPLPNDLKNIITKYKNVIIPEINNGQLIKIIRDKYLVDAKGINQIKGTPFDTSAMYEEIKKFLN